MIQDEFHYEDLNQELAMNELEDRHFMETYANDKIVKRVVRKMKNRSKTGQSKYGSTMWDEIERDDKNLMDFMTDIQEEMMDGILYLEAAKECLKRKGFTHKLFKEEDGS